MRPSRRRWRVAKQLKKNAVLVADAPAFVFNRLLIRMMSVITEAVDQGTPATVADEAMRPLGLPMPPFVLLHLVGPPIVLHATESLHAAFPERFPVSDNLRALVAAKKPGLYDWGFDGRPYVSEETAALLSFGDEPLTAEQVRTRALEALAEEAGLLLAEGVVAAPMDIDLCLILGGGWPFALGGHHPVPRSGGHFGARARAPVPAEGRGERSLSLSKGLEPRASRSARPSSR